MGKTVTLGPMLSCSPFHTDSPLGHVTGLASGTSINFMGAESEGEKDVQTSANFLTRNPLNSFWGDPWDAPVPVCSQGQ